jgi:hypothetical protein
VGQAQPGDRPHLNVSHAQEACNLLHRREGQEVAALALGEVQQRDGRALAVIAGVLAQDALDYLVVGVGKVKRVVLGVCHVRVVVPHRPEVIALEP